MKLIFYFTDNLSFSDCDDNNGDCGARNCHQLAGGVRCGDWCGDGANGGCPEGAFCTDNDDGTVTCGKGYLKIFKQPRI